MSHWLRVGRVQCVKLLVGDFSTIDGDHGGPTFAETGPIISEVALNRVLPWRECLGALNPWSGQIEQIIDEDRLSFQQVECPSSEATAGGSTLRMKKTARSL
jgi:hypothetical protein